MMPVTPSWSARTNGRISGAFVGKIRKWAGLPLSALRREILEETGLEITNTQFVLVQDCIHSPEFYRDAHFVLLNYTARCIGKPQVKLNDEAREFEWVCWKRR